MAHTACPTCRQLVYGEVYTVQKCPNCETGVKIRDGFQAKPFESMRRRCDCGGQLVYQGNTLFQCADCETEVRFK